MDKSKYKLEFEVSGIKIYTPTSTTEGYHLSRYSAMVSQEIYASSGATSEVLNEAMDFIIDKCNQDGNVKNFRTDIAAVANSIKYRTKYPVDEHCMVRIGCILSFMETADGQMECEELKQYWMAEKEKLAFSNPDAYSFFLSWGLANSAQYEKHLNTLKQEDYFQNRKTALRAILPSNLWNLT